MGGGGGKSVYLPTWLMSIPEGRIIDVSCQTAAGRSRRAGGPDAGKCLARLAKATRRKMAPTASERRGGFNRMHSSRARPTSEPRTRASLPARLPRLAGGGRANSFAPARKSERGRANVFVTIKEARIYHFAPAAKTKAARTCPLAQGCNYEARGGALAQAPAARGWQMGAGAKLVRWK